MSRFNKKTDWTLVLELKPIYQNWRCYSEQLKKLTLDWTEFHLPVKMTVYSLGIRT